ncbi:hypothetical protein [Erysipelothrix piscisicarius]|uniref:hypothetical protein n=1 Tax=Erysipelothrix piscisicarius TaxID=2485784 RepID=UPI002F959A6B
MNWLYNYLEKHELVKEYTQGKSIFAHLSVVQEALLVLGSSRVSKKPLFIIKENEQQASNLYNEIKHLDENANVVYYNHEESLRVEAIVQSEIMKAESIDALFKIVNGDFDICITHMQLLQ